MTTAPRMHDDFMNLDVGVHGRIVVRVAPPPLSCAGFLEKLNVADQQQHQLNLAEFS